MAFGFLTDKEIKAKHTWFFPKEYVEEQATGASYDLGLGEEVYISGEDCPKNLSESNPFVSIPRGQFALLITKEYIKVPPDYLGLISIRFSKKAQGLINVSGFHVDPGFEGKILFSVFNGGPSDVILKYGEPTFMIFFYKLREAVDRPYKGDMLKQEHLPTRLVTSIKGVSASLADVDKRVGHLEIREKIYWALLMALVTALVALFIKGT